MRTKEEIEQEIFNLRQLKPVGPHQVQTQLKIEFMVEELEFGLDETADEFDEMTEGEWDSVRQARAWKEGETEDKPSTGWGSLVR